MLAVVRACFVLITQFSIASFLMAPIVHSLAHLDSHRITTTSIPAVLALADGSVFHGVSIGASGHSVGEVVFNTSLTGYQEILTDPSYSQQLVTLTYPHIGNVGINPEDMEGNKIHAAGLIIRDLPLQMSNFRATSTLSDYLHAEKIVAIAGIDTRRLTRILREKGAQNGALLTASAGQIVDIEQALALARGFSGLLGKDLAKEVSTQKNYTWTEGVWSLETGYSAINETPFHVVAFDFGVKRNILRMLASRGCKITVVPATTSAQAVLELKPDGVFLSNGPGDPAACSYAIAATRTILDKGVPTFGICLGHQIMALALGAKTLKMKFGHHGANHPVQDLDSKRVLITSQNHGFAVDANSLPSNCRTTHISLFDQSLQGFALIDRPAFCFQGHPEASPGPHDIDYLFDRFIQLIKQHPHS